jgi:hypothetical protein
MTDRPECKEETGLLEGRAISRREFLKLAGIAGAVIAAGGSIGGLLAGCGSSTTTSSTAVSTTAAASSTLASTGATTATSAAATVASGSLVFPKDSFTEATKTVTTADGDKAITYRLYEHLAYVGKPVDANYQSLNVSVPVKIDGADVDATNAPMLLDIGVGGYMSSSNTGSGGSGGMPGGGMPGGGAPGGGAGGHGGMAAMVSNADLALAAGYVVVSPGCRGRDNVASDGAFYGKAPAAIVDLKCAVKYVKANKGVIPGNTDWIISNGTSAGGALSALLGASGDSDLYSTYFDELEAADASDAIFGSACYCPITDLEHADAAYEWMFGAAPVNGSTVDQALSKQLADQFVTYQAALGLKGQNGYGALTADKYADYLIKTYLAPAATTYLAALSDSDRQSYLSTNSWLTWANNAASFNFQDYVNHCGRMKTLPAFDAFDLSTAECILFGNETTDARHFTEWSLRQAGGDSGATLESDLPGKIDMMNPMHFIGTKNAGCASNFWIRYGTSDANTSLPVIANLAAGLETIGKKASLLMYWDAGHGANQDSADFMTWIGTTTGYKK